MWSHPFVSALALQAWADTSPLGWDMGWDLIYHVIFYMYHALKVKEHEHKALSNSESIDGKLMQCNCNIEKQRNVGVLVFLSLNITVDNTSVMCYSI